MKKTIPLIIALLLFISFSSALAETKTFIKEYTYQASEYDSKVSCRALALEQVKRLLLEEVGTYLESQTEVKNFQLSKDQITVLTAGVVRTEILKEAWDGKAYWFRAKIEVDTEAAITALDKLRKDRVKTKELEETKRKVEEALNEIERLRKELQTVESDQEKKKKYDEAVNVLSAKEWFEKGDQLRRSRKYKEGFDALTRAIEIDPQYTLAYVLRGICCLGISEKDEDAVKMSAKEFLANYDPHKDVKICINDFNKAINLDSNNARAYRARGYAYGEELGYNEQAIRDFDKCIELESTSQATKTEQCYYYRARTYKRLGQDDKALADYNKAIEIDPTFTDAWEERAVLRGDRLVNYEQAIKDLNVLIRMHPNNARFYVQRGYYHRMLDRYKEAIDDLNYAIEISPKYAFAYYYLGVVYTDLKEYEKAISHYTKAIELSSPIMVPTGFVLIKNEELAKYTFARGKSYARLSKYDKAMADYTTAIELEPLNAEYYVGRGDLFYSKCNEFSQSIKGNKNKKSTLLKNKWCRAALKDYVKSSQLDPKNVSAYIELWRIHKYKFNNVIPACYYARQACELDPDPVPIGFCEQLKDIGDEYCEDKWASLGKDSDGGRWYYEKKADLRYSPSKTIKIWVRQFEDEKSKTDGAGFKALYEIDCSRKMQRAITYISIKRDGTSTGDDLLDELRQISPGSMIEMLANEVCKKTKQSAEEFLKQ